MRKSRAIYLVDYAIRRGETLPANPSDDLIFIDFHGLAESVIRQTFPMSGRLQEYARQKEEKRNSLNDVAVFIGILKQHRKDIEDGLVDDLEDDDNWVLFHSKQYGLVLCSILATALLTGLLSPILEIFVKRYFGIKQ